MRKCVLYGFNLGSYCLLPHLEVEAGLCPRINLHGLTDELGFGGRGRGSAGWLVCEHGREVKEIDLSMERARFQRAGGNYNSLPFTLLLPLWLSVLCWYKRHRWDPPGSLPLPPAAPSARVPSPPPSQASTQQTHRFLSGLLLKKQVQSS